MHYETVFSSITIPILRLKYAYMLQQSSSSMIFVVSAFVLGFEQYADSNHCVLHARGTVLELNPFQQILFRDRDEPEHHRIRDRI